MSTPVLTEARTVDRAGRLRALGRSGLLPAVLTVVAAGVTAAGHGVAVVDVVRFGAYVLLGLVLPGLVLWRVLVPRPGSSLPADAVFGTTLALAVELGVYTVAARLGVPGLAWVWPVVPLGLSLLPGLRPMVWRRAAPMPLWWSWSMSGLMLLGLVVMVRAVWAVAPLTPAGLRNPYVDLPYQLALVTGLSRRVRTDLPFVQGEPLYYHWFTHAHVAAERHATGIEPIVLLSRLDMLLVVGVVLLGSAMLAHRVARSPLAGIVATGVLTTGGSALLWPQVAPVFLTASTYISPTTPFACAALVGCAAVTVEILDPGERPRWTLWVAAVLLVGLASGAKGPAIPVLLAGWVSVVVMALVVRRRLHTRALALSAIGLVVLAVAQRVVYGGSAQGLEVVAFGLGNYLAYDYGLLDQASGGSLALRATLGTLYAVLRLTCLVAVAGLFTSRVWRNPHAHFLVGAVVGGVGAMLFLESATRNQVYFLLVVPVFMAAATGWGLVELLRRVPVPLATRVLLGSLAVGAVVSVALRARPPGDFGGDDGVGVAALLLQPLLVVGLMVVVGVTIGYLGRRTDRSAWRHAAPLALAGIAIGLGLLTGPRIAVALPASDPADEVPSQNPVETIAPGGIVAARWLREHSDPGTVVATNSHCRFPAPLRCDHRAFWISAYSERQMLLEGWAYTSRSAALAEKYDVSVPFLSYWEHDVLMTNERAFWKPTPARLDGLRREHGVRWLFVDKRFRADVPALERLADLRYENANYAVFRLP